ncbi:biotin--[acetyl-CoA-carboxylase] ligase [Dysgonomonas sp. 511]|uniref:biotin--[acetyl-CoA-carboxylase] ligase n=1 Tax=Dysgonomonas sp. 511 TaxID=2302930 RepID=UPI0013D4DE67|nr:biotin--[acetyl-CoA-carboxylase] ligase [Dysgonomonas sp. 511]NDV77796.1 biotin--[acetyl-CoA-carboxylase] ligase [Dysgonomonas sp. 511]
MMDAKRIHMQACSSTNTCLLELAVSGQVKKGSPLPEGSIIWAEYQTSGKGQQGNSWESGKGENLLFSIIFYPTMIKANEQFIISQMVSLAVAECLQKYVADISIKWPNDIYWREKKICGILIENNLLENTISQSVCGIGININQDEFVSNAPNPVSLMQITGKSYDRESVLDEVNELILTYYQRVKENDYQPITEKYKSLLFRRNGYYKYSDKTGDFLAKIKDIKPNGLLVLETNLGEEKLFAFKEVKYVL